MRPLTGKCTVCGKPMPGHWLKKYCSGQCTAKGQMREKDCAVCGKRVLMNSDTATCGARECKAELSRRTCKKLRAKEKPKPARLEKASEMKNPFAGALTPSERAELDEKVRRIKALISNHGGNLGSDSIRRK